MPQTINQEKQELRKESLLHRGRMIYDLEDVDQAREQFFASIKPQQTLQATIECAF